jgi:predicted metalloprotease with PDZ domain
MQRYTVVLLASFLLTITSTRPAAAEPPGRPVHYTFELLDGPTPGIRVHLSLPGDSTGVSRFYVQPHWGSVDKCERFIIAPAVSIDGKPATLKPEDGKPNCWQVEHAPGAQLEITHELRALDAEPLARVSNDYRPIVRDDLMHVIGETGLLLPEWLNPDTPRDIRLTWIGFDPRGWKTISSIGPSDDGLCENVTLAQFRHSLFFAGKIRVHEREVKNRKVRVAVYGDDWDFTDEALVELVRRIVTVERDFFDDHNDPHFLVSLIPSAKRQPGSRSLGGTGLTNCFALFIQPGPTLEPGSRDEADIAKLLCHEYFHHWNGERMQMSEPDALVYWFSEGFTDFYASRLLFNAGLIDAARWTSWLNDGLTEYWTSPSRDLPNSAIVADFWKSADVQKLPYRRGEIIALLLDWEIRARTKGSKSLDHFMRELYVATSRSGEKLETDSLLRRIATWTSEEFAEKLRGVIERGQTPTLPADLCAPALEYSTVEKHSFDMGFDFEKSRADKKIVGVREGGPAHRAGLRDGMEPKGYSVYFGDATKAVTVNIRDEAGERKIEYLPHGSSMLTPQYKLVGPLKF